MIPFEILIEDIFSNVTQNNSLDPMDNKTVLSLLNDFENGKWRYDKFQRFIWNNIKETALSYKERQALLNDGEDSVLTEAAKSLRIAEDNGKGSEISEILLYGIMKHHYNALPVVPKIFYKQNSQDNAKGSDSVHIVIENDDINFNIEDVLYIGQTLNIPVVFDALHNAINHPTLYKSDDYYIKRCKTLWQAKDGNIKTHYSQQATGIKAGAHSKSIKIMPFINYYHKIKENNADIMLEVKDKNLSALKCLNTVKNDFNAFLKDFERYKFSLMSKSPLIYNTIKENTLKGYDIQTLYSQIENALDQKKDEGFFYTLLFIKDILKCDMTANQLKKFETYFARVKKGNLSAFALKNYLYSLSVQFDIKEIYESYFFVL